MKSWVGKGAGEVCAAAEDGRALQHYSGWRSAAADGAFGDHRAGIRDSGCAAVSAPGVLLGLRQSAFRFLTCFHRPPPFLVFGFSRLPAPLPLLPSISVLA